MINVSSRMKKSESNAINRVVLLCIWVRISLIRWMHIIGIRLRHALTTRICTKPFRQYNSTYTIVFQIYSRKRVVVVSSSSIINKNINWNVNKNRITMSFFFGGSSYNIGLMNNSIEKVTSDKKWENNRHLKGLECKLNQSPIHVIDFHLNRRFKTRKKNISTWYKSQQSG